MKLPSNLKSPAVCFKPATKLQPAVFQQNRIRTKPQNLRPSLVFPELPCTWRNASKSRPPAAIPIKRSNLSLLGRK